MTRHRFSGRTVAAAGLSLLVAAAGAAIATPASAATAAQIRPAGTTKVVKDSYVVVLRSGQNLKTAGGVTGVAKALTKAYGGKIGHTYRYALEGFELSLNEKAATRLAGDSRVSYVQRNGIYSIDATQSPATWGLDRIDQPSLPLNNAYTYTQTAANVRAYIIDTGLRATHAEFTGRTLAGYTAVNDGQGTNDCNGHGTHVAGTVGGTTYGVAKAIRIVPVRVLTCAGDGTTAGVVAGIDWVTANAVKPAVANMSLGGGVDSTLDAAVNRSISAGITYAVAAGNNTTNACNSSPARVPNAITVGATTTTDARSSFSNYGTCLDIFAPGSNITSAWNTSNTATNTISGTSMASPHAAGVAALILSANPSYTPAQVRSSMVGQAAANKVTNPGTGSPNLLLQSQAGSSPPPVTPCTASNGTDVAIPDAGAAVNSPISISGCGHATALSTSTAEVHIVHTYRGDLKIDLVAPDGSVYALKAPSGSDSADNVNAVYSVNVASEGTNGLWNLRVQDVYSADTGYINTWTLSV